MSLIMGSKRMDHWTSGTVYKCSEIAGSTQGSPPPLSSRLCRCEAGGRTSSEHETGSEELCEIKWDYCIVGTTASWCFRTKPASDESTMTNHFRGHQWTETMLTEESRFHTSTPLGIIPGSLITGSKQVDHWTSGTVYECSEIAGSPHVFYLNPHGPNMQYSIQENNYCNTQTSCQHTFSNLNEDIHINQ
jgi:hypothetical protein